MNKLPAKQIYLLLIIVGGLIGLSVYSTYSIFTLEAETDDIVSIHTPNNLSISSNAEEYKQVTVPKNGYIDTDIDIYNNLEYNLCYSVWYKIVTKDIDTNSVTIYENTDGSLLTSSTLGAIQSRRINLLIINDNDKDVKVNFGLTHTKNEGTCELNMSSDKLSITKTINNPKELTKLSTEVTTENKEAGYITYKDIVKDIKFDKDTTIYVSDNISYENEIFTLKEPKEIDASELDKYNNKYTCLDKNNCRFLTYITEVTEDYTENDTKYYKISKYNSLVAYLAGEVGVRKVGDDYYFYGDSPSNYVYYNCKNEIDTKTCELWRIVGFTKYEDDKYLTKLVKDDYIAKRSYDDDSHRWKDSAISKYLKDYKLSGMTEERKFKEEYLSSLEDTYKYFDDENKAEVTLITLSDYLNASSCKKDKLNEYDAACLNNNWLNKYTTEWTMTAKYEEPKENEESEETITPDNNKLYTVGSTINESVYDTELNVRPVIYLKSRVLIVSGNGTLDNPYIIR